MRVDRNLCRYQGGLEEGATLASFVLRIAEVAGDGHADRITEFITDALNKTHLPAIILDRQAIVTATNSMVHTILESNINIKGNRLWIRDCQAYSELIARSDEMTRPAQLKSSNIQLIFVQRHKKRPVLLGRAFQAISAFLAGSIDFRTARARLRVVA
jgi:hypothetical protein